MSPAQLDCWLRHVQPRHGSRSPVAAESRSTAAASRSDLEDVPTGQIKRTDDVGVELDAVPVGFVPRFESQSSLALAGRRFRAGVCRVRVWYDAVEASSSSNQVMPHRCGSWTSHVVKERLERFRGVLAHSRFSLPFRGSRTVLRSLPTCRRSR